MLSIMMDFKNSIKSFPRSIKSRNIIIDHLNKYQFNELIDYLDVEVRMLSSGYRNLLSFAML